MNRKVWKCLWGVRVQELSKPNEPEKKPNTKKKLLGVESKLNRTGTTEAKKYIRRGMERQKGRR